MNNQDDKNNKNDKDPFDFFKFSPNSNNNNKKNGKKSKFPTWGILLIIVGVITIFNFLLMNNSKDDSIPFSEFKNLISDGTI